MFIGIVLAITLFMLVVGIHELGHFTIMRMSGVKVSTFAIGIGPALYQRVDKHGTYWKVGAIPLGGYVQPEHDTYVASKFYNKMLIAFAGPAFNIFSAVLVIGVAVGINDPMGGLMIMAKLLASLGDLYVMTVNAVVQFFFGSTQHVAGQTGVAVSGPIGITKDTIQQVQDKGIVDTALDGFLGLSIGLAMFNLLPFPMLDGWRIVMSAIEPIFGKDRIGKFDTFVSWLGFVSIIGFMIFIAYHDTMR